MYPPVEMAKQLNINEIDDSNPVKDYLQQMVDGNEELLLILSIEKSFGTGHYDGPYKEFSDYIHSHWETLYTWSTGKKPEKSAFNRANRAAVRDALLNLVLISKWGKYKKVYRFDPELELAFGTVDEIKIPVKMLEKLPYKSIYLEFAPGGVFDSVFHGCFVTVTEYPEGLLFNIIRMTDDMGTMAGVATYAVDYSKENPMIVIKQEQINRNYMEDPDGTRMDWEEFCFFMFNAMLYLCASNADIRQVDNVPSKKAGKIKKVLPEIYECGYVYGQTLRLNRQAEEDNNVIRKSVGERKSPRPHPVKASWQHYWKGSGENKERVLVFKEAYFTGSKVDVATISRVV